MMTTLRTADGHVLPGWRLRRVTEYIQQILDKDVTLAELADVVDMSPYLFCSSLQGQAVDRGDLAAGRIPNPESLHHGVPARPGHHARSLQSGGTARRPTRPGRRVRWIALRA
jgi:hypothetical protein